MSTDKHNFIGSEKNVLGKNYSDGDRRINDIKKQLLERMNLFFREEGHHPALKIFFQTAERILLSGNAKRLRFIIPVLIGDQYEMPEQECINYGVIVEMLHYTSLIHDDVIDQDMFRRGCETLNNNFSNSQAILLGDYILCMALHECQKFTHNQKVTDLVVRMVQQLITGIIIEQREMGTNATLDQYRNMAELKTGSLFSLSFGLPFVGDPKVTEGIVCGRNFGTMFQIFDDYLDREDDDPGINSFSMFSLEEVISLWNETTEEFLANAKKLGIEKPVETLVNHLRKIGYFREEETEAGVLFQIPTSFDLQ